MTLTRNVPLESRHRAALLFIDVQNFSAHRDGAEFHGLSAEAFDAKYGWYFWRTGRPRGPEYAAAPGRVPRRRGRGYVHDHREP